MGGEYRLIARAGFLWSRCAPETQVGDARKIVLPHPQLIHGRAAKRPQLWELDSRDVSGFILPRF
jgi:hypothetical protein